MKIFIYRNNHFPDAVTVSYENTPKALSILGGTAQDSRTLQNALGKILGSRPLGVIRLGRPCPVQSIIFAAALAIRTDGMEGPSVLVVGTTDLRGNLTLDDMPYQYLAVASRFHCPLVLMPLSWSDSNGMVRHVGSLLSALRAILAYRPTFPRKEYPFRKIVGLEHVKRALLIAMAGEYHTLLFGPPGTCKSMALRAMGDLLDDIPRFSVTPTMDSRYLEEHRVEMLAKGGILYLDELPAQKKDTRRAMLSIMDRREVIVASAMNNCPCGGRGMKGALCSCSDAKIRSYWAQIGCSLLDRYDIRLPVPPENLLKSSLSAPPGDWKDRLLFARREKKKRGESEAEKLIPLSARFVDISRLSPRALFSLVSLARTIADFDGREILGKEQILEAYGYKRYGLEDFFWSS